jgi:glycosyltransferase involved in cell wall biosynthesis
MNILFLNSLGKSKWGGGEKWMILAGKGLKSRGHSVKVACKANSLIEQKTQEAALSIVHFSISMDIAIWKIPVLSNILLDNNVDVVICCQNKDVKIGAKAARRVGTKAIFARQGVQNLSNKKKYIKPFTQFIDGIITNTLSIKKAYENFGWFPNGFIHVIYNGVEIPENVPLLDMHKKYKLPNDSKVVFSAGRIDHQKGFDLLIEVAQRCKSDSHNWQFVVAGEGKLKQSLVDQARHAGVDDLLHFIGFSDQVVSLLRSCTVFVLPSRFEGMPNALLEAMAMGKASVATRVNGAPELVEDKVSGFLVESENINELYEKLGMLLSDETLRKEMELNAKLRVKDHFTVNKMIDKLETLFLDQISKRTS